MIRCLVFLMALFCFSALPSVAEAASPWMSNEPQFTKIRDNIPANSLPGSCTPDTKFIKKVRTISTPELSYSGCATATPYGVFNSHDGALQLFDHARIGQMRTHNGAYLPFGIQSLPNSNSVLVSDTTGFTYGRSISIVPNFKDKLTSVNQSDGTLRHTLPQNFGGSPFKDPRGEIINFSNFDTSKDTKWAIGNAHRRGFYRVNTETSQSLHYDYGYNHAIGLSPNFVSAVSSNGKYALHTENRYEVFKLYDLSSCTPNSDSTKPQSCQTKDLHSLSKSKIPEFSRVAHASFDNDYTIKLYVHLKDGSLSLHTLAPNGFAQPSIPYIALGDSFASGEGAHAYKNGTDERDKNTCHLSQRSYPYLLPTLTTLKSAESVACSGAKIKDIIGTSYDEGTAQSKGKNDPKHDSDIYYSFLPGYRHQINFLTTHSPKNTTVSIGGNDIGFGKILRSCIGPGTCYASAQEKLNLDYTIDSKLAELTAVYKNLAQSSERVFVIGYPSLAKTGGNCGLNVQLNSQEVEFSNKIIEKLNAVIQNAAIKAGVHYIDVSNALNGKRLCETDDTSVAVHGITAGDDRTASFSIANKIDVELFFSGRESFHPNHIGHQLLATRIAEYINKIPEPISAQIPSIAPHESSNMTPHKIVYDDSISDNILIKSSQFNIKNTTSTSVKLADIPLNKVIPESVPTGMHLLRAATTSPQNEPIELQKLVYVAASVNDLDGDGIVNDRDECNTYALCELSLPKSPPLKVVEDSIQTKASPEPVTLSTYTPDTNTPITLVQPHPLETQNTRSPLSVSPLITQTLQNPASFALYSKPLKVRPSKFQYMNVLLSLATVGLVAIIIRVIIRKRLQW